MRTALRWSVIWLLGAGGCFEDAPGPVDDGPPPSTGPDCTAGTEGCPCIDGACVAGLSCLSNVCVDQGGSGGTTTNTTATTTPPETTSGPSMTSSVDEVTTDGPLDTGSPATTDGGTIPPGRSCDPLFDLCEPGVACIGLEPDGFICLPPGPDGPGEPCDGFSCGPGLLCIVAEAFVDCPGTGCCALFCDVFDGSGCAGTQFCEPFFPGAEAPPGYEHVGVCVEVPSPV